ncbi:hypothetical protein [Spiroplasma endosymbiont of Aleiodes alternator]|uniref:hypothetical protein n=1 Tax=Spiroplasma endosymbiont of Aleiodes alternator TaxID=3139329 RepID=UPI003CCB5975
MVAAPKKKPEDLIIKQIHIRLNKNDYYELKKMCLEVNLSRKVDNKSNLLLNFIK